MNYIKYIGSVLLICCASLVLAQQEKSHDKTYQSPFDDVEVQEIVIISRSPQEQAKLRRDVLRAYPYAIRAAEIIEQIDDNTLSIKKKRYKRRYINKKEEILRDQFEENLKKLTKTQGRYMVRLINRETGDTVYNIIKEYKNGLNAIFWQFIAKKFNSDLKAVYQPQNTESIDFEIERIVRQVHPQYVQNVRNQINIKEPTYRDYQP